MSLRRRRPVAAWWLAGGAAIGDCPRRFRRPLCPTGSSERTAARRGARKPRDDRHSSLIREARRPTVTGVDRAIHGVISGSIGQGAVSHCGDQRRARVLWCSSFLSINPNIDRRAAENSRLFIVKIINRAGKYIARARPILFKMQNYRISIRQLTMQLRCVTNWPTTVALRTLWDGA